MSSTCCAGGKGRSHGRRAELENAGVKYILVDDNWVGRQLLPMPKIMYISYLHHNVISTWYSTGTRIIPNKV